MTNDDVHAAGLSQLAIVARELGVLSGHVVDAAAQARGLAAATDWQARAAGLFHERAEEWAGEVSSLVCIAESARLAAVRARDVVAMRAAAGL